MSIMQALPGIDEWLDSEAESWSPISVGDYIALVRQWRHDFLPLIAAGSYACQGGRAVQAIEMQLPMDVSLISGVQVPELANMGGRGAAGYQAVGLRRIRRELANRLELINAAYDLSWSCVFSHEAGACAWESFYERKTQDDGSPFPRCSGFA